MASVTQILVSLLEPDLVGAPLPELLCRRAASELPVDGVTLSLMAEDGHGRVLAASNAPARAMDELQFVLGEGPCLAAWRAQRIVLEPNLARTAPSRWPGLSPALVEIGIGAIFAFPLQVGAIRLGVLSLCRLSAGRLSRDHLASALAYADVAVTILLHQQNQLAPGDGPHPQLADPPGSASQIHQATGMISIQASVGLTEALLMLRAHAYVSDRLAVDVARDVVDRKLHFYPDHDGVVDR